MYAIKNKTTGKWVYGSDKRYYPYHQRTSHNQALTFENMERAEREFMHRMCGKDYEIVEVELKEKK